MMEVKQNTSVDLNDLLTSAKNNGTDEVDDTVMRDLSESSHNLDCDLIKTNEKPSSITELENGDDAMESLIVDDELGTDIDVPTELEDALLADDDVLPKLTTKEIEPSATEDDILADKVETSNSTTSSINARDPGDDLDTLLSKINDIVDECNDNDIDNTVTTERVEEHIEKKEITENNGTANLEESVILVEESIVEDNKIIEDEKSEDEKSEDEKSEDEKSEDNSEETHKEESEIPNETVNKIHIEEKELDSEQMNDISEDVEMTETVFNNLEKEVQEDEEMEKEKSIVEEYKIPEDTANVAPQNIGDKENHTENEISSPTGEEIPEVSESIYNSEQDIQEKTDEEAKLEAVQDNEITSNSHENLDALKCSEENDIAIENDDSKTPEKENEQSTEFSEKKDSPQKDNEKITLETQKETSKAPSTSLESQTEIEEIQKDSIEENKTNEKVENEDSDDEIVFYVDKPPEKEKSQEKELASENTKSKKDEPSHSKASEDEDDCVVLLDDDDDEVDQSKQEKNKESKKSITDKNEEENPECKNEKPITPDTKESQKEETEASKIDIDNSDNARDDFETEKNSDDKVVKDDKTEVSETPEETNSNCSSSSNLLQEAKSVELTGDEPAPEDEPTPEDAENEEEEDDADVELIEGESKEADASEKGEDSEFAPPPKRLRLSEDSEVSTKTEESNKEQKEADPTDQATTENKPESQEDLGGDKSTDSSSSNLKRTHDVIELEVDEKSNDSKTSFTESINKKPRTEEISTTEILDDKTDEELKEDEPTEDIKDDIKEDVFKAVPSYKPIPLYPPPKFETLKSEETFSLDFLKKFRKSFDNMTKTDLEELVLQKVVEAIIHRSEFSEMRELIEKQEKQITAHRTKISEISKQFRDLEMVHNRVVKDIEQRNSQFIMPVKITRAVGLQVYIPNKKSLNDAASGSTPSVPVSPQRPVASQATSSTSTTPLTSPQRQFMSSQTDTQNRSGNALPTVTGVRRGCVQKITPTRPVPGSNTPTSTGPTTANSNSAFRNNPNQNLQAQPRILNKNATTTNANAAALQRGRFMAPNTDTQRSPQQQQQQQVSRPTNVGVNSQRIGINPATQQKTSPNVAAANAAAVAQRRSDPMPQPAAPASSSTSSIVDNYMNTLTHLAGGNTAVSITPAKPKEKAVIDLTDEDEAPTPPSLPPTGATAAPVPVTQIPRRSLPVQNNTNSQNQYGRTAPPLARIPPVSQMANNKNRQMSAMQAQKNNSSFTSISTPAGTSITRINVPTNSTAVQRVKYSHPAPLPATPPQAFNPSWKLPPPRPTIRISNLDNGIVISWTMEESMDRHAECVSYQIYAYQETSGPPMVDSWRHVGDVKAMLLPMAVTLTQFQEGQRYYFAVRAVDCHQRFGPFSLPKTWS